MPTTIMTWISANARSVRDTTLRRGIVAATHRP
jgi:hypothetical protein